MFCALGVALLLLGGCESSTRTLVLTGSSTVAPLASEIGKAFERAHPGVRVDVQTGGSSRGIADTRAAVAHAGMVSRALKPAEADLRAFTIANDGIGLIVHADNPVRELSKAEVAAVFTGKIEDWSELGAPPGPITVVNKAEGRSTLELFLRHFQLKNSQVQAHVVIGDNEQGVKTVAGSKGAIGYVSIGTAEYDAAHGVPIRLLPLGGAQASTSSVQDGSFPLSRPLNLVTLDEPRAELKTFIDFALSPTVDNLVREQYFVPIKR